MSEDDVRAVMAHPSTMIGSDGIPTMGGKPHPRLYGTFARVLGHYSRDEGVLALEEAVHRMTGMAAAKFGLAGRGVIEPGAFAYLGRALAEASLVGREACGSPVAVNPDSKLRCLATASGWPILRLR